MVTRNGAKGLAAMMGAAPLPAPRGWRRHTGALEKTFILKTRGDGLHFVAQVGALAEHHDHHPALTLENGTKGAAVRVVWTSHHARAITEADVRLAGLTDGIARTVAVGSFASSARPSASAEDLPSFAARVLETARTVKTGRFGEHDVFISHIWRKMPTQLDADEFIRLRPEDARW